MGPKNFLLQLLLAHLVLLGLYGPQVNGSNSTAGQGATDTGDFIGDADKTTSGTDRSKQKRIIGGEVTGANQFIWMAYLYYLSDGDLIGGATILTRRHVLTCAHNVNKLKDLRDVGVVVGGHNLTTDLQSDRAQKLKVHEKFVHPKYPSYDEAEDIAVLILTSDIVFNDYVDRVYLPSRSFPLVGKRVTALGWGDLKCAVCIHKNNDELDSDDDSDCEEKSCQEVRTDILHSVCLCVVNPTICAKKYPSDQFSLEKATQLCVWGSKRDTCKGDSGGPLVYQGPESGNRYVQVGIISGGDCGLEKPSYNIDVSSFMDWIELTVGSDYPLQKLEIFG